MTSIGTSWKNAICFAECCTSPCRPTIASLWDLLDWIVQNGHGSYGLVCVHDEDLPRNTTYWRGNADYSNEFRVWRIRSGKLDELKDPFLSPIVSP